MVDRKVAQSRDESINGLESTGAQSKKKISMISRGRTKMVGWRRVKRLEQMRTGWGKRIPLLDNTPFTKLWVGGREKEKGPIPCMHVLYTRGRQVARARYTQVHARPCTTRQYQWATLASLPGALCNPQAGTQQSLVRQPGQKKKKNMDRNREPPPRPLRAIEGLVQVLCRRLQ